MRIIIYNYVKNVGSSSKINAKLSSLKEVKNIKNFLVKLLPKIIDMVYVEM